MTGINACLSLKWEPVSGDMRKINSLKRTERI